MKIRHLLAVAGAAFLAVVPGVQNVSSQSATPRVTSASGTLSHGAVVTISGSGFGSKATAAPIKYEDFQGPPLGATIYNSSTAAGPAWNNQSNQKFPPIASTARLRPGTPFTRNMQSHWSPPDNQGASNVYLANQNFRKFYIDFWTYMDVTGVTSGSPNNIKPFRLHSAGASAPSFNIASATGCATSTGSLVAAQRDGVNRSDGDWYNTTRGDVFCNKWAHIQVAVDAGSGNNSSTGSIYSWVNGLLDYQRVNVPTTGAGQTSWPEIWVGNYIRNDSEFTGNVYSYWESVYIDNSWARVEIGNNATYGNSTQREIQVPTSWTSSSISVTINRGSFSNLSNLYLFVIDANGNTSPGFALSALDGGSSSAVPTAPSNLRITSN